MYLLFEKNERLNLNMLLKVKVTRDSIFGSESQDISENQDVEFSFPTLSWEQFMKRGNLNLSPDDKPDDKKVTTVIKETLQLKKQEALHFIKILIESCRCTSFSFYRIGDNVSIDIFISKLFF